MTFAGQCHRSSQVSSLPHLVLGLTFRGSQRSSRPSGLLATFLHSTSTSASVRSLLARSEYSPADPTTFADVCFFILIAFTRTLLVRRNLAKRGGTTLDKGTVEELTHHNAFEDMTDIENPEFRCKSHLALSV